MIISENSLEITMPAGKHYAELTAKKDDSLKEYSIFFRYVESGYKGSSDRMQLVNKIFEDMGFSIGLKQGRTFNSRLITNNESNWKEKISECIRLVSAIKDTDLRNIDTDWSKNFEGGATGFGMLSAFEDIKIFVQNPNLIVENTFNNEHYIKPNINNLFNTGTWYDKRYFLNLLVSSPDIPAVLSFVDNDRTCQLIDVLEDIIKEKPQDKNKYENLRKKLEENIK